ncbi:MAG: hypothetical protein E7168_03870 [Firmicutes bacterium]|nr:hypothetical protein [Bacillota bacterium]
MESIVQLVSNIFFFCLGYIIKKKTLPKKIEQEEDKIQKEKQERIQKAFNELMEYDYSKALGSGHKE